MMRFDRIGELTQPDSRDERIRELEAERDSWKQQFRTAAEDSRQARNELQAAWDELKKHLRMNVPETVLGGIRNLAQVAVSMEDAAERAEAAEAERDRLVPFVEAMRSCWRMADECREIAVCDDIAKREESVLSAYDAGKKS
jgi:molecular chaperone GrpE (heat shock protein)